MVLAPIALSAMLMAGPANWPLRVSFVLAIAAHCADLAATAACTVPGWCREVNPLLRWTQRNPVGLGLTKGGMAAGLQIIPYEMQRRGHPRAAFWFNMAQTGAFTYLAIRNAKHSHRAR